MQRYHQFKKHKWLPIAAAVSLYLHTAVFAITQPDAGTLLKQPGIPGQPPNSSVPSLENELAKDNPVIPGNTGEKIQVNTIEITGETLYSEKELRHLWQEQLGKELSLGELEAVAGRITQYLHEQGYLVASAYIPKQVVKEGTVQIAVLLGRYGKIDLRNHSRLKTPVAALFLEGLKSGAAIHKDRLDQALLLLGDTSGIQIKATLTPGETAGSADLIVQITDGDSSGGAIYTNNWGSYYTGTEQWGSSSSLNNLSGRGDTLLFGGAYSGSGMNNYSLTYLVPIDGRGTQMGAGYSSMHYQLGEDFASLDARGVAKTTSLFGTFRLLRSRNMELVGRIEYNQKKLVDRMDIAATYSQKRADTLLFGLSGSSLDTFWAGGRNTFGLTYTSGNLHLESSDAVHNDANAQTAGRYHKTNLSLQRLQGINPRLKLYLSFLGQWADKNLDSSEKMQIGGPAGVRAYPVGEAPGDDGYLFTGELRWNLPNPDFQVAAFYDRGRAILNHHSWNGAGENQRTLSGAGIGFIWNQPNQYMLRLDYAWKIGREEATADKDKNGRLWLQSVKYF